MERHILYYMRRIKNIRKTMTDPFNLGKPPKEKFNLQRWAGR